MKRILFIATVVLFTACGNQTAKEGEVKEATTEKCCDSKKDQEAKTEKCCDSKKEEAKKEGSDCKEAMTTEEIKAKFADKVDQEVSVKGTVVHVCKHGGKKLHLVGADDQQRLIVFASDDLGKFETELEGSDVVVKGIVKEQKIDEAYLAKWEADIDEHHKDDKESDDYKKQKEKIESMREELKASEKGYLPKYSLEATKCEETAG